MTMPKYERLSFLDNSFLLMEGPSSYMHVGGVATYEMGSLRTPEGGVDIDKIRTYVASRLSLIPRYRQRIEYIPVENHPVWVDDEHFNIYYHVRHTSLPQPGEDEHLKSLAARVLSQRLDRAKPLWEMWVVEGLAGGDRFAILTKVHHCMIDGMSSVDLMNVLLSLAPEDAVDEAPSWIPRPVPTKAELVRASARRWLRGPFEVVQDMRKFWAEAEDPRSDFRARLRALRDTLTSTLASPSETPMNKPIGAHRRFDWLKMNLDEVKAIKNRLGGSVNDVVLTIVAGAVRAFLERRRVDVEDLDFRVMAPVSVRTAAERGTLGNRVSAWIIPMPIAERDPLVRLARIRETTADLKDSKQAVGAEMLTRVGEWTPSTLLSLGASMMSRNLPFNLVVTNVPGPQIPLFMLGSRMLDMYGQVPLTANLGMGIVLFSYAGNLCWGFTADFDLLPDLSQFVRYIEGAFQELRDAADAIPREVPAAPRKPEKARPRRTRPARLSVSSGKRAEAGG